jgi:ribosomal protein S18 acetylase RimI-like enzyme
LDTITIVPIEKHEIEEATLLLSRAFIQTPFTGTVMGGQAEKHRRGLQKGFDIMLRRKPGDTVVAKDGDTIVGVMRMVAWPECQNSSIRGIEIIPAALMIGSAAFRVVKFRKVWNRHDPREPHLHIDPLGVLPERQGQGIGSRLLSHFCEIADTEGSMAYLETDQEQNVRLYERFGFTVEETEPVFGITNWFMYRRKG